MNPQQLPEKFLDFEWFANRFFSIRDRSANLIPFAMNPLQKTLYPNLNGHDDVLKARKGGVSTLIDLLALHRALTRMNQNCLIVAHRKDSALELFRIVRTAYDHLPDQLRPRLKVDTRTELEFAGIGSRISVQTARTSDIGRASTIDFLHCSEIAFWDEPQKIMAAAGAALGDGSEVYRESTPNGAGNYWHTEWIKGKARQSGYQPHFFDWRVEPSYRIREANALRDPEEFHPDGTPKFQRDADREFVFNEEERALELDPHQARWRRRKKKEHGDLFKQEYPEDDITCFITSGANFFDIALVQKQYDALATFMRQGTLLKREEPALGMKIWHSFSDKDWMHCEFVIGADTSEGLVGDGDEDHGDFSAATILEKRTGLQVATMHGLWEPYEFAHVLAKAGTLFATPAGGAALLGVERNEYGHAVLNELLRHIKYPNLYYHTDFDEQRGRHIRKLGWRTNAGTRPLMLGDLQKALGKGYFRPRDPEFLAECMQFVRKRNGRPEAQQGCFDDRVISAAIAWQMRQTYSSVPLVGTNIDVG